MERDEGSKQRPRRLPLGGLTSPVAARDIVRGGALYACVEAYSDLGDHRTGTDVDRATREWLVDRIEREGGRVSLEEWTFDRYVAEWSLEARGRRVETVPLFYSGLGRFETTRPAVRSLPLTGGVVPSTLAEVLASLPPDRPGVLATEGDRGHLVAINRDPEEPCEAPVLLAGACDLERLETGPVRFRLHARTEASRSANVLATFGDAGDHPYVVTTPLTGWFRCAGERGTGIAIALAAAKTIAEEHPVLFVATTGHELEYQGVRFHRGRKRDLRPRAVLQIGASVAAGDRGEDGSFSLSPRRFALATSVRETEPLSGVLDPVGFQFLADPPPPWPGEGELWRDAGAPLLAFTGAASTFHTPDDLPENATTPEALEKVADGILEAALRLPKLGT